MALMFGRNSRGGGAGGSQPKNVVEFRAGKMALKGNMVHPDKRKGQVYIYQSEDGLTHFCWKDRTSSVVEDDLIIFPEDAVFSKVTQCKEGSRVFLLKFKASSRKLFYWMQEPKSDGDEDFIWKVNDAINNPGGSGGSRGTTGGSTTPTRSELEMQNLLQSMSQSQLMQLIGGMGMNVNDLGGAASGILAQMGLGQLGSGNTTSGSGTAGTTTEPKPVTTSSGGNSTTTGSSSSSKKPEESSASKAGASSQASKPAVQLQDLQKILSGMQPSSSVDLATGVSSDFVKRITACPTTVKKLAPLLPKFGFSEGKESEGKEVADTLISPAFQHALSSFCSAFPTGQLGPLVEQFEFGTDAVHAARNGNLEAFLNAIQKDADAKISTTAAAEKPEDMNVD